MRICPPERAPAVALVAAVAVAGALAATAVAAFSSSIAPVSETISTTALAAPTALTANCVVGTSNVTLTWTATTSAAAAGYAVLRGTASGGPYAQIGTVNSRTTTTFTDTIGPLATQYYTVKAMRNNWTSAASNQAGVQSIGVGICQPA